MGAAKLEAGSSRNRCALRCDSYCTEHYNNALFYAILKRFT